MTQSIILFAGGLIALYWGAHGLILGASRMARDLGVNPLVIGLTVVAMGTSMPELLVGVVASLRDSGDIAIGNVVGSNIANIALILGLAAMIRPIHVQMRFPRREVPIMIGASVLFYLFAMDGGLSRWDGAFFLVGMLLYMLYLMRGARVAPPDVEEEYRKLLVPGGTVIGHIALSTLGLTLLLGGAHFVVSGATAVARWWGVSELAVGLTAVALGTSLPELATAVAAAVQDEGDILVGNVVGSNVFNIFSVLGFSVMAGPLAVSDKVVSIELPVMVGISVLLLPFAWTALRVSRVEAGLLLASYAAFVIYLALPN